MVLLTAGGIVVPALVMLGLALAFTARAVFTLEMPVPLDEVVHAWSRLCAHYYRIFMFTLDYNAITDRRYYAPRLPIIVAASIGISRRSTFSTSVIC